MLQFSQRCAAEFAAVAKCGSPDDYDDDACLAGCGDCDEYVAYLECLCGFDCSNGSKKSITNPSSFLLYIIVILAILSFALTAMTLVKRQRRARLPSIDL